MTPSVGNPAAAATPVDVCAIVLSWNGERWLHGCLASLCAQTHPVTIVVVDNASSDGGVAHVRTEFPGVAVIQNSSNFGVAEGYNVGLRHALALGARYALVLNQDTTLDPAMVGACVKTADADGTIGAIAPLLLFASDPRRINSAGIDMNAAAWAHDRGVGQPMDVAVPPPGDLLAASGGAMFLRCAALQAVGLFDADYFAYYEDVDLCLRLWTNGYRVVFTADALVLHHYSASFGPGSQAKMRLYRSNRWRLVLKHFPAPHLLRIAPALLRDELHQVLGSLYRDGVQGAATVLATYGRILVGLRGIAHYRRAAAIGPDQRQRWWRFVSPQTRMPRIAEWRPAADVDGASK
jgi:GT2 family glycosyltransferase